MISRSGRVSFLSNPIDSGNPNDNRGLAHSNASAVTSAHGHSVGSGVPFGSSDSVQNFPISMAQGHVLNTFDTQRPPLIPLTPGLDHTVASRVALVNTPANPPTKDQSDNRQSDVVHPNEDGTENPTVNKFTEALADLPQDRQAELTVMFKQFLGDKVSVGSAATESLIDEDSESEETESPTFRATWSSLCGAVRDWVPSVPEVGSSPQKRRRTVAALDRDLAPPTLLLHPDISSTLDSIMNPAQCCI